MGVGASVCVCPCIHSLAVMKYSILLQSILHISALLGFLKSLLTEVLGRSHSFNIFIDKI